MYYKIINAKCEVYKKLHDMRSKEIDMNKRNLEAIKKKVALDFDATLGYSGQQSFKRVKTYCGFKFKSPEKVNRKIWKESDKHKGVFIPNKRTKLGREINDFLERGLETSSYVDFLDVLEVSDHYSRFKLPYIEIVGDSIIIYLDEKMEPKDENVIEITKTEFNKILHKE